jgi:hypothetical protein
MVETIKVISTRQASKRRRSSQGGSDMARVYREATSHTSTKKKLIFNVRMSVKPQEEWTDDLFEEMFSEKPPPTTLEQHVGKLEKYEKEELIHRDIVCYLLLKLITRRSKRYAMMTHKYWGCIVVLLINKSVESNEEQKVLTSGFDQGFTVNTSKRVFRGIW